MDYDILALSPDYARIWNVPNFLLAACLLSCIYLTVYLIKFQERLVETNKYKFLFYIFIVTVIDATFLFMCYKRLSFDDIFAMIVLAPLVYFFKEMFFEIFEYKRNK